MKKTHAAMQQQCHDLAGKEITLTDSRSGWTYLAQIAEAAVTYGRIRLRLTGVDDWFQPTPEELASVEVPA